MWFMCVSGLLLMSPQGILALYETEPRNESSVLFYMPEIQHILIKYATTVVWKSEAPFCNSKIQHIINVCKGSDLLSAFLPDISALDPSFIPGLTAEPSKRIDSLCSQYNQFTRCIDNFGVPDNCISYTKMVTTAVYNYTCGVGKENFRKSSDCLVRLTPTSMKTALVDLGNCSQVFQDASGIFRFFISFFHMHDGDPADPDIISSYLQSLCSEWSTLRGCFFRGFRQLCGTAAEEYYSGLLTSIQNRLVSEYSKILGDKASDLIHCRNSGLDLTQFYANMIVRNPGFLRTYAKEQFHIWNRQAALSDCYCGPCNPLTIANNWVQCFWIGALNTDVAHVLLNTDLKGWKQNLCNEFAHSLLDCYDDFVHCHDALDYGTMIHAVCNAVDVAIDNPSCIWSLTSETQYLAGSTFPDLLLHTFSRIAITLNIALDCNGNAGLSSVQLTKEDRLQKISYTQPIPVEVQKTCGKEDLHTMIDAIKNISTFSAKAKTFADSLKQACHSCTRKDNC